MLCASYRTWDNISLGEAFLGGNCHNCLHKFTFAAKDHHRRLDRKSFKWESDNISNIPKTLNLFIIAVSIASHSLEVTELDYPAITICKENGLYDPGEYIRPVFNLFQYACKVGDDSCKNSEILREHYKEYVGLEGGLKIDEDTGEILWSSGSNDTLGIRYTSYLSGLATSWLTTL